MRHDACILRKGNEGHAPFHQLANRLPATRTVHREVSDPFVNRRFADRLPAPSTRTGWPTIIFEHEADFIRWCFAREDATFESYEFLLACDPLWALEYEQAACFGDDPWLAYSRFHTEPIRGSQVHCSTERETAVLKLAERYGFRQTAIVPAPAGSGSSKLGMLVLGSEIIDFFEGDGYAPVKVLSRTLAMELNGRFGELLGRELLRTAS